MSMVSSRKASLSSSRGFVVVGLQRDPALLGDEGAVLAGGIVGDPCDVGDHVSTLR